MKKKRMELIDFKSYCEAHNILRITYSSENNKRTDGLDLSLHFENIVVGDSLKNICLRSERPTQRADTLTLTNVQEIILEPFDYWDVVTISCKLYNGESYKHVLLIDYCIGTEPKTVGD